MRILVLSQYYWPESFRINEVVESLRSLGCHVTVLTSQPCYPLGEIFAGYRARSFGSQQHAAGYTIYRVPIVPRGRGGAIRLAANYLSFIVTASIFGPWLLRKQRFDVIFVFGISPILQAIPAVVLKWLKRTTLVTWVQDLWPLSLEATGFVRNRFLLASVGVLVKWIYRRTDLLLVQSQAFISSVKAMSGKTPVLYHPQPGELTLDKHLPMGEPALVLDKGFNVVFAGNLGTVQALGTLLDASEILRPYTDIRIVLVGSGSRSKWLQQEVFRRQLANVQLAGSFAPEAMPGILAQASTLLVSLVRNPIMSLTVPGKVQAYMAAGKPIIASLDGEGARVVAASGAGLTCPAEDAWALAQAVLRLKAMPLDELRQMGESGLIYYKKNFDLEVLSAKLIQHFAEVLARNKS